MIDNKFTECLEKWKVAEKLAISNTTLSYYLNNKYLDDLLKLDYHPRQKKLTPKQLNYLKDKIDLQNE